VGNRDWRKVRADLDALDICRGCNLTFRIDICVTPGADEESFECIESPDIDV
jgi:hypothetical protein